MLVNRKPHEQATLISVWKRDQCSADAMMANPQDSKATPGVPEMRAHERP